MGEPGRTNAEEQRGVVRFRRSGFAVGAGMLLTPDVVATCAHVVTEAAGLAEDARPADEDLLTVDLPFLPGRPGRLARVWRWSPPTEDGGGDVALLRLTEPAPAAPPAIRRVDDLWDRPFRAAGFPPGREEGTWVTGTLRPAQASGWVQLDPGGDGFVGPGFSGTPVWDADGGCVVAMGVAADLSGGADGRAYALPIDRVLALAPELLGAPYRGLVALDEDDAEFFFGRAGDVARSLEVLREQGLLVLAGGSGSGKSSLLRAGVVPAVRALGRDVAVVRLAGVATSEGVATAVAGAVAELAEGPGLLVVDQLEDLAGIAPDAARSAVDRAIGLAAAGTWVAVTSRWSTFDVLSGGAPLAAMQRSTVAVAPLDRAGLRAAVAGPADRVPGPTFDAEVVERIVDDAGHEPGRLPLVATLLAELWRAPDDGRLTLGAYERVGRVEGAIVTAAEQAWAALDPGEQAEARAALTAMGRPTDSGFARRPVALGAMPPTRRRVVERLAAARLVVVGRGPEGEVAEPAHQALLERWPRLRTWLLDDVDFLRWRAALQPARGRWAAGRNPAALLRGGDLETGLRWLARRREDLDDDERAFLEAGERRRRRDRRIRLVAVSVVAVLAVVAGTLAAVLDRSNSRLTTALDTANARALGQLSASRLAADTSAATQFALAASASDADDADARTALGQAYLARLSTTSVVGVPTTDALGGLRPDPDADATLVATLGGAFVVDGLAGPAPQVVPVPGVGARFRPVLVTGGGRFVVSGDGSSAQQVWDRASPDPPRTYPGGRTSTRATPDGTHLIGAIPTPDGTLVEEDDLIAGTSRPLLRLPEQDVQVWPTGDPRRVLVRTPDPPATGSLAPTPPTLTLRDLGTGAVVTTFPAETAVAAGGRLTVGCRDDGGGADGLTVSDAATAAPLRRITTVLASPDCRAGGTMVTADGNHVAWVSSISAVSGSGVDRVQLADVTDGRRSSLWAPSAAGLLASRPSSPEYTSRDGSRMRGTGLLTVRGDRALLADGPSIETLVPSPVPAWRDVGAGGEPTVAFPGHDGSFVVVGDGRNRYLRTVEPATGAVRAQLSPEQMGLAPGETVVNSVYPDGSEVLEVLTTSPTGPRIREFTLPGLQALGVYDLAAAGAGGLPTDAAGVFPVLARAGDRLVVLSGGVLSWWSAGSHELLAPPVTTTDDPGVAEFTGGNNSDLRLVDDRGDTVGFRTPDGISTWTLGSLRPGRVDTTLIDSPVAFTFRDRRLTTLEAPGELAERDPSTGAEVAPPTAVPGSSEILGVTPGGDLVTGDTAGNDFVMRFWNGPDDRSRGALRIPEAVSLPSAVVGGRWTQDTRNDLVTISIDADRWRADLCRTQDRPFTDAERALLPPGADTTAPCHQG